MKNFLKVVTILSFCLTLLFLVLGVMIFYFNNPPNFNYNFFIVILGTCGFVFPAWASLMVCFVFRDSVWKNQKQIDDLRIQLNEQIEMFRDSRNKLVKYVLKQTK